MYYASTLLRGISFSRVSRVGFLLSELWRVRISLLARYVLLPIDD